MTELLINVLDQNRTELIHLLLDCEEMNCIAYVVTQDNKWTLHLDGNASKYDN